MGITKEKIKISVDDFKKMQQKNKRKVKSANRHRAKPSEYSKRVKRMSNVRLRAEAISKHKAIEKLEKELQFEQAKFVQMALLLGLLTHPQINYDLRDLIMDGVQSPSRTDYEGVVLCKEDELPMYIRTGDQKYWKTLGLQCEGGHELTEGQLMSVEHYEDVVLSDAVLIDPKEENLTLEELQEDGL